ncbi:kinase-like domain-containing protein [Gorgonomyces haynaldii]|nr:kinase-like domain-containing protein [Gorgonomyces haynaldii]
MSMVKHKQGQLLLVSLLEQFCRGYQLEDPEDNSKLFHLLCQRLVQMGFIESHDLLNELSLVREEYKNAFLEMAESMTLEHLSDERQLVRYHSGSVNVQDWVRRSRFQEEFTDIHILGRGAFGHVSSCRNKLDDRHYAVKVIPLDTDYEKTLREVKLLSKLQHSNVVRYFSSWLEHCEVLETETDTDEELVISRTNSLVSLPKKELCLFLQMELCSFTLYDWIEERNKSCKEAQGAYDILFDILNGLGHIHGHHVIHRDLKPSNIYWRPDDDDLTHLFFDKNPHLITKTVHGTWKIGDFGLATSRTNPAFCDLSEPGELFLTDHTKDIGTITYASPEQLNQSTYSCSSDMYSVGIIFFELLYPMQTHMERAKTISELRDHVLPSEFLDQFPKESALILWMMAEEPSQRPSPQEILKLKVHPRKPLEKQLEQARAEIERLRLENQRLEQQLKRQQSILPFV